MHRVQFGSHDEAVAFIAALSRYLSGPDLRDPAARDGRVHVWATPLGDLPSAVYLSDAAFSATAERFGTPAASDVVSDTDVPGASRLLIGGGVMQAWGEADVRRLLSP